MDCPVQWPGIAKTEYRIYNQSRDTGWITYTSPFYLTQLSDGAYSIDYRSIDNAGNVETTTTAAVILDNTPPSTSLTIQGPKYVSGNTVYGPKTEFILRATDTSGSGIQSVGYKVYNATYDSGWVIRKPFNGGQPVEMSAVHLNQLADGTYTFAYRSVDNVGNVESAKTQVVTIDNTPPEVTINVPGDGAEYLLNQVVTSSWSAKDTVSGIASVSGTSQNGSPIDTGSLGQKSFVVTATDNLGNTNTVKRTYYVRYVFGGVLQPIDASGTSVFKLGRTVPVKFQLRDANGKIVSTAIARISLLKLSGNVAGTESEVDSTSAATTGNLFRYDSNDSQYIFNLDTKPLSVGTWRIVIWLDDGTSKATNIGLK